MASQGKRSAFKAVIIIVIIIVIALLLVTPSVQSGLRDLMFSPFQQRYPESVTFTVEDVMSVQVTENSFEYYVLDTSSPITIAENGYELQQVSKITINPTSVIKETRYGLPWISWNESGPSASSFKAIITYEMTVTTHFWNIGDEDSLTVNDIPQSLKTQYLHDEWKIEMTDTKIVKLANSIVGSEKNVHAILSDINNWVTTNIQYPNAEIGGDPQSATETLSKKIGDCDDQAILFISLARAAGVPAWLQLGALYVGTDNTWGGHGWVQAYIPEKNGAGENVTIDTVNKDFLVWTPNKLAAFTDDGDADHLSDYYHPFTISYHGGGVVPTYVYTESYVSIAYTESEKKVSQGTMLTVDEPMIAVIRPT